MWITKPMSKIATLGPAGTFSDIATQRFLASQQDDHEVIYFPSIKAALAAIGHGCDIAILPIENFSEGFIPIILDQLIESSLMIMGEIVLPIQFSFVSNAASLADIDRLYVQFVAKGQCSEFIAQLGHHTQVVLTESNIESLDRIMPDERNITQSSLSTDAAIVPVHSLNGQTFRLKLDHVNDYQNNQTRFLIFSCGSVPIVSTATGEEKTSIIVLEGNDHPGLLAEVLAEFSKRSINLTSIISRPTRKKFGKYHFFIDFDGSSVDSNVAEALAHINTLNPVKILGSYKKCIVAD
jgi:prephenate dehydratase